MNDGVLEDISFPGPARGARRRVGGPALTLIAALALLSGATARAQAPKPPAKSPAAPANPAAAAGTAPEDAASARVPKKLAEGVWAMMTRGGANAGWFTFGNAVVAVDSGRSAEDAEAILAAIARTAGPKAVSYLILTNDFGPHAGGAAVFAKRGATIVSHENFLGVFESALRGPAEKNGARDASGAVLGVASRLVLASPGRHVVIRHVGPADSAGDLAVLLTEDKILFSGDLAEAYLLPPLFSKSIDPDGWLSALTLLQNLNAKAVVPGYGPIGSPQAVPATREYLEHALNVARTIVNGKVPEDFYATRIGQPDLRIVGLPPDLEKSHEANVRALVSWLKKNAAPTPAK